MDKELQKLSCEQIKDLLQSNNIQFDKKAKKSELLKLLLEFKQMDKEIPENDKSLAYKTCTSLGFSDEENEKDPSSHKSVNFEPQNITKIKNDLMNSQQMANQQMLNTFQKMLSEMAINNKRTIHSPMSQQQASPLNLNFPNHMHQMPQIIPNIPQNNFMNNSTSNSTTPGSNFQYGDNQLAAVSNRGGFREIHPWSVCMDTYGFIINVRNLSMVDDFTISKCIDKYTSFINDPRELTRCKRLLYAKSKMVNLSTNNTISNGDGTSIFKSLVLAIDANFLAGKIISFNEIDSLTVELRYTEQLKAMKVGPVTQMGQRSFRPQTCFAYNRKSGCSEDNCLYTHKCRKCFQSHPVYKCKLSQS